MHPFHFLPFRERENYDRSQGLQEFSFSVGTVKYDIATRHNNFSLASVRDPWRKHLIVGSKTGKQVFTRWCKLMIVQEIQGYKKKRETWETLDSECGRWLGEYGDKELESTEESGGRPKVAESCRSSEENM